MSAVDTVALIANSAASDAELVDWVRGGDEEAFEELFRRYHSRVRAFVTSRVTDHGRADDITQDVFLSALRHLRAMGSEINFKPWLFQIARNATIDLHRRSSLTEELPVDKFELVGAEPPEDEVMRRERLTHLQGAFGELNEVHHRALVMRELEGRSYREIGERLRLTQAGVEGVLFRARRRLAKEYRAIRSAAAALLPVPFILRRRAPGAGDGALAAAQGSGTSVADQAVAVVTAAVLAATGAALSGPEARAPDPRPAVTAPAAAVTEQARNEVLGHRPHRAPAGDAARPAPDRHAGARKGPYGRAKSHKVPGGGRSAPAPGPGRDAPSGPDAAPALPRVDGLGLEKAVDPVPLPDLPREAPLAGAAPALPKVEAEDGAGALLEKAEPLLDALKGRTLSG
jgi:RNA polymerase sigma factor (sigma-70 family)